MNTTTKISIAALVGIIVGAGSVFAFTQNERVAENTDTQDRIPSGHMMDGTETSMHAEMNSMNTALEGKTGDAFDQAFLSGMIVHHQGAVAMAQAALKNAKHQEIKDLAQKIITTQTAEIAQMQSWQKMWYSK